MSILDLMEHIAEQNGVSEHAKYPFKVGYMSNLIETIMLCYPETRELIEQHARSYNYEVKS